MDGVQPLPNLPVADLFSRCPLSGDWNLSLERMHLLVGGLATEFAPWIRSGGFRVVLERPRTAVHSRHFVGALGKKWRFN